jgi:type IV secretory pathway TraG/TraD family ATPase VirD4
MGRPDRQRRQTSRQPAYSTRNRVSMWAVGAQGGATVCPISGITDPSTCWPFAPTRSGKGVGLVIPTLLAWSESAVVYDIKGENWAKTAGFRAKCGHLCFKFSPVELANGSRR